MASMSVLHRAVCGAMLSPSSLASATVYQQTVTQWLERSACAEGAADEDKFDQTAWRTETASDLFVYVQPSQPWWQRWLWGTAAQRLVERISSSLLVVQQPRWPLRHILLIVRADQTDWTALPWIERLAAPGQTCVSILPIVPPWPRLHRISEYAQPEPEVLLAPNTVSGAMLAQLVRRLTQRQISTTLSLTRGEPDWRIREEVATSDPDLIVIAAESEGRWVRWFQGELVRPLLHWVDRPLLIAR